MAKKTPERFVAALQSKLDGLIAAHGPHAFTKKKVSTIVSTCGWKAKSAQRMAALQNDLEVAGIYPYPFLTDGALKSVDWIRFSRRPGPDIPLSRFFAREGGLQEFIRRYHVEVFGGIPGLEGLELVQKEHPLMIDGGELSADLVFRDPDRGRVVVELKLEDPSLGAPNQLRQYMDALANEGHGVRGVLVTGRPVSESVEKLIRKDLRAQRAEYPIDWYWYSVDVSLKPT